MFDIDYSLFFQIANFLILYFLLKKFLYKPVISIMQERETEISTKKEKTEKLQKEINEKLKEYELMIASAKKEVEEHRIKLVKQAEEEASRLLSIARTKGEQDLIRAKKELTELVENLKPILEEKARDIANEIELIFSK